jgi:hypothetical protein
MGTAKHVHLALITDPGICTNTKFFRGIGLSPLLQANVSVTKECEAPESNRTLTGTELTWNIPRTTSLDS